MFLLYYLSSLFGRFGKIFMFTREKHIYTFESFCQHIRGAFGNSPLINVVPVIAIMDYKKYYDEFIDEKLVDKFSKVEGTQLYFKFQPLRPIDTIVNPFKLVVRTNYRKNGQDYTVMLRNNVDDQRSELPFVPHLQHSQWIPENGVDALCESVVQPCPPTCSCKEKCPGISFLKTVPTGFPVLITFEPWINGHHAFLSKVNDYFTARGGNTTVVDSWISLSQHLLPKSDSNEEYFRNHSVAIPLGNILFNPDATFGTDAELNLASSLTTTEISTLTGFSNNSHAVRRSMFDIELMEHISQNTQTIPWRGHRTIYKNWDFSKDIMLQRVIVKRGAAGKVSFITLFKYPHLI